MQLEKIISLANKKSQLQFVAMVRSLRATGCNLPVWVIPYDNDLFELPDNCIWWDIAEISDWVNLNALWPAFKKIQCLLTNNFQYVDSDIIFFKNPAQVLISHKGFVTSCTHWNNPNETITTETAEFFRLKSTTWQKLVFNSGQWACDIQLYELEELIYFCEHNYVNTLFKKNYLYKDQAGINILVNCKNVIITNLTLPPYNIASTWAGDYLDIDRYKCFEKNEKPFIVHWAGTPILSQEGINKYIFMYLTESEKARFVFSKPSRLSIINRLRIKLRIFFGSY